MANTEKYLKQKVSDELDLALAAYMANESELETFHLAAAIGFQLRLVNLRRAA